MYIAFVDIKDIYSILSKYNIEYDKYNINISNDNIKDEIEIIDNIIQYNTQFISYTTLIFLLKSIKSCSIKSNKIDNIYNLDLVILHLSKTFPDIASHIIS